MVRYIILLCILVIHLGKCFTAEAGTRLPAKNVSTEKKASLSPADLLRNESGEVVRSFQLAAFRTSPRDHRFTDGIITVNKLSTCFADHLQKRFTLFPATQGKALIRLLLFPNHYFW